MVAERTNKVKEYLTVTLGRGIMVSRSKQRHAVDGSNSQSLVLSSTGSLVPASGQSRANADVTFFDKLIAVLGSSDKRSTGHGHC